MFVIIHFSLFTKDNIVNNFKTFTHSFNNFKWFLTIIKMPKLYEVKRIDNTIKTTTIDIIKLNFFCRNKSIYKDIIKAIYTLKMFINLISIRKFQFDNIIYNGFNRIIIIESIKQKVAVFI